MEKQRIFTNYPCALNALDANFQPAYRPSGRFGEQNRFFSGKHKLYGFKLSAPSSSLTSRSMCHATTLAQRQT